MRLIIQLDEKLNDNAIYDNDIILTNCYSSYIKYKENRIAFLIDFSIEDDNPELSKNVIEMFNKLPANYMAYINTFYSKVYKPICSIVTQIERIIKNYNVDSIVLIGGSEHLFLTLHCAEGEGIKWMYKSSWLLNPCIYNYFNRNNKLSIIWWKKHRKLTLSMLNRIRELILIYASFFAKLIKSLRRIENNKLNYKQEKRYVIAVADLKLQLNHLRSILDNIPNIEAIYILSSKEIAVENINYLILEHPGLVSLVKIFIKSKLNNCMNVGIKIKDISITIPYRNFMQSLRLLDFQINYKINALTNAINKLEIDSFTHMVTDMTFGPDISVCNFVAHKYNLLHINFQYVAMTKMLFPLMNLADKYYLYSNKIYELYRNYSNSYKYYLPIKKAPIENYKKPDILKLTIFTQPDKYTDKYLNFISNLISILVENKISAEIIIKPHYRQDKIKEFEKLIYNIPQIKIANNQDRVDELILSSDITVSMTSSVLFESLMLGKMGIIINFDETDKKLIDNICFPEVNFTVKSMDELIDIINKYQYFYNSFLKRYDEFIKENNGVINYAEIF